ncbi:DUF6274 family protein [Streptomyces sp. NPDC052114]|uniref:DUF6274 family protein n=1 Tax=unclassified Streptomyces TaxID=2593676 RepID=UPI003431C277
MSASSASVRHETRALLRAHLAAATSYRHLTRHCPICHQLLRLALEPSQRDSGDRETSEAAFVLENAVQDASDGEAGEPGGHGDTGGDESPPKA